MATQTAPGETQVPRRRTDEILTKLADVIGGQLSSSPVFGAPVERDGTTVVPIASVSFGFGGGSGSDPAKGQDGEGGGGGGRGTPVGYIELKGGRTRFVPVVHPGRMAVLVCLTVIAALGILRSEPAEEPAVARWRRPSS